MKYQKKEYHRNINAIFISDKIDSQLHPRADKGHYYDN